MSERNWLSRVGAVEGGVGHGEAGEGGSDPLLSVQRAHSDAPSNRKAAGSMPSLPSQLTVLISLYVVRKWKKSVRKDTFTNFLFDARGPAPRG